MEHNQGTTMRIHGVTCRPAGKLDIALYQDVTRPAVEWANENLTKEMIDEARPPVELITLTKKAKAELERLGFMYTPIGLFVRDEPDILKDSDEQLIADGKNKAEIVLARIMQMK